MRAWPVLIAAGCIPYDPHPPSQTDAVELSCHVAEAYSEASPVQALDLECIAHNEGFAPGSTCVQPVAGVRETGAVYTSHSPVCSSQLAPDARERIPVRFDVVRAMCADGRGGCEVRAFKLRPDDSVDAPRIVAYARELEAHAAMPGRDRPTLAQCAQMIEKWLGDVQFQRYCQYLRGEPDELRLFCLGLPRATYGCLSAASSATQADACAPRAAVSYAKSRR